MKRALDLLAILLACSVFGQLSGCLLWQVPVYEWHGSARHCRVPTMVCCSADGKLAAYAEADLVDRGLRCYYGVPSLSGYRDYRYSIDLRECRVSVHLVGVESPDCVRSIDLGIRQPFDHIVDLKFSPDGSHLAALDRSRIVVIGVKTGQWRSLCSKPHSRSLAWFSNAELGYLASGAVWRQEIHQSGEEARRVLPRGDGRPFLNGWTSWSPDGRYVIVGHVPEPFYVVDLMGTHTFALAARPPWRYGSRFGQAAWSADSTTAICWLTASAPPEDDPLYADHVFRIEPSRRQATLIKEAAGPDRPHVETVLEFAPRSWMHRGIRRHPIPPCRWSREIYRKEDYTDIPDYVANNHDWSKLDSGYPLSSAYSRDDTLGAEIFQKPDRSFGVRVVLLKPPTSQPRAEN